MGALDQQQQPEESRASNVSQQLEASNVDLLPEETTNISQLIELDLLSDRDKKKNDDDSDEEVWSTNICTVYLDVCDFIWSYFIVFFTPLFMY